VNGWFRLEQLRARALLGARARLGLVRTTSVDERHEEYRGYWSVAARRIGAEFVELLPGIWEVRRDGRRVRLANHVAPFDDAATRKLAGDKVYCYGLARGVGVPVPAHLELTAGNLEPAREFLRDQSPPFVVKPASDSASALGVTTHVGGWREFRKAAALASLYDYRILLERMVAGESCRLLFLNGRLIHAVRRRGLRVTGDGRRTIRELLGGGGRDALLQDPNTRFTMAAAGLDSGQVPAAGADVLVRSLPTASGNTRELRTVYDEAVTHLCAPELISQLARVVDAVGSEFAGIDVITNDLGRPLEASGGTFLEINTTPGIHHHYVAGPDAGTDSVAQQVLAYLFRARS
jgi:D-alanine-D-alanine ligase-like ATP-grasp enzyme